MAVRNSLVAPVLGDHLSLPATARAEAALGHRFARPELLQEAFTHRSAGQRVGAESRKRDFRSNERLEFVGDRVLGLLMAEWLADRFPDEQEGELGRRLAHLVSQPVLAGVAERIGLPDALTVGANETSVRRLATVLADAIEAMLGAVYTDGGLEPARRFVRSAWGSVMTDLAEPPKAAKTALQEWAQGRGLSLPSYRQVSRSGPPHNPVFVVEVQVKDQTGTGTASTKRAAEETAAEQLLERLKS